MFKKVILFVSTAALITGMAGWTGANELNDLKRQIQRQEMELENTRVKLQEIEKKIEEVPQAKDSDFRAFWNDGLRFETKDKAFQLRLGGRIHHDWTWISEDDVIKQAVGTQENGVQFRRTRLYFRGDIHENTHFRIQLDFAGAGVAFKDVFMEFKNFPVGKLKIGQFKEPFSLDELTSSNNITFLERALPTVFAASRNLGAGLSDSAFGNKMTWSVGVFRETADDVVRVRSDSGYNATGRVTFNPVNTDGGKNVLHLGAAYSNKWSGNDTFRFRQRPETHMTDRFVDTGNISADSAGIVGLEAAWVSGPFSLQGEYNKAMVSGTTGQVDVDFTGYYLQGSFWLTGENRRYDNSNGTFGFVRPNRNLGKGGGWGAWELAARYSNLDLNDNNIQGGKLDTITVGLNWHLNNNTRVMWNYVHADRDAGGSAKVGMMRLQVHF